MENVGIGRCYELEVVIVSAAVLAESSLENRAQLVVHQAIACIYTLLRALNRHFFSTHLPASSLLVSGSMASTLTGLLTRIITLPFTLAGLILARILGVRRLRWNGNGSNDSGSGYSSLLISDNDTDSVIVDPAAAAQWFLRYIKTCDPDPDGQGVDGSLWYTKGGYSAALRRAKDECEVLCVVLTSKEHDDNAAFMRWVALGSLLLQQATLTTS